MAAHTGIDELQATTSPQASRKTHCSLTEIENFLDRKLPREQARLVAEHLALCEDCSALSVVFFASMAHSTDEVLNDESLARQADELWQHFGRSYLETSSSTTLDEEIDRTYEEVAALSREPASPDREAKISSALARLKELQRQEADQFQQQLESRLTMPIDAGARILERADALRKRLEDLAAKHRATDRSSAA
jgi:hypothetical protein